jgi:hypothetical protein
MVALSVAMYWIYRLPMPIRMTVAVTGVARGDRVFRNFESSGRVPVLEQQLVD